MNLRTALGLLGVATLGTGCFSTADSSTADATPDVVADASPDAAPDAAPDTAADVAQDTAPDAAPDVAQDAAADASPDVAVDATEADAAPTCGAGQTLCGSSCVELARDPLHCGACGRACAGGEACELGRCALRCPAGQMVCGGACRDTSVDRGHCGACDNACAEGEVCERGMCRLTCGAGLRACGGACRNLQTDAAHCGACGMACPARFTCVAGACTSPCAAGQSYCGGACVDTSVSVAHCGACDNACATGRACVAGRCVVTCPSGQTACGDACVNLQTSNAHCGACGRACASGQSCASGTCTTVPLTPFPTGVFDHDAAADGAVAMIGQQGSNLLLRCVRADGSPLRADQTVATSTTFDTSGSATQVHIGARSNTVLVTWMALQRSGDYQTRQYWARVFDASCEPVTAAFTWPSPASGEYVPDVAMADDGRFVVLWKAGNLTAAFFTPRGALEGTLEFPTRSLCSGGGYGSHVALNPRTGDGIVTCQQHQGDPIYYQRFSAARTLVDATPVRIAETTMSRSSWYESHIVGMNADGAFVIEWQNASTRTWDANFYDASGRLVRNLSLAPTGVSQNHDGFRQTHQAVELLGANFVLRAGVPNGSGMVWRYNAAGDRLGCATLATSLGATSGLRSDTVSSLSVQSGTTVRRDAVTFAPCP